MKMLQNFTVEHSENNKKGREGRQEEGEEKGGKKPKYFRLYQFLKERFKISVKTKIPSI